MQFSDVKFRIDAAALEIVLYGFYFCMYSYNDCILVEDDDRRPLPPSVIRDWRLYDARSRRNLENFEYVF